MRNTKIKNQSHYSDMHRELREKQSATNEKREEFKKEWERTYRPSRPKEPPKLP
jgi:hypothetical protein